MSTYPIYNNKGIEKHKIASYQIDMKGQATLPVLCNLFQEIAGNHAYTKGFGFQQMIKTGQMWVLTGLKAVIDKYPKWNDDIFIETWIRNRVSFLTERDFLLVDKNENKMGGALSGWMLLDLKTRRPITVENIAVNIEMFPDEHSIEEPLKKIPGIKKVDFNYRKTADFQDIDINQHVNNVKYIEWFLASFPYEFRKTKNVKVFEINYLAEMTYGESVEIKTEKLSDNSYRSCMINSNTQKEICRAEIEWLG